MIQQTDDGLLDRIFLRDRRACWRRECRRIRLETFLIEGVGFDELTAEEYVALTVTAGGGEYRDLYRRSMKWWKAVTNHGARVGVVKRRAVLCDCGEPMWIKKTAGDTIYMRCPACDERKKVQRKDVSDS